MCRVTQCCCGCSLKTGTITCCVLTAIAALHSFISGALILSYVNTYKNGGLPPPADWPKDEDFDLLLSLLNVLGSFALLAGVVSTLAFLFILIGILADSAGCLMVWLVFKMMFIVSAFVVAIIFFCSGDDYIARGFIFIFGNVIAIYFWIVVKSYYHELNDRGFGHQSLNQSTGVV